MAKEREITTKFKVDISDLKAGITEANRHIRLANSEFKAATAGMDKWSTSADGLKAKIKQLNTVIEAEKDKLKILEEQYKRVAKECGASSKEAEEMAIKVNNQKAAVGKAEAQLKKYTEQLKDVKSGAKSFDSVGNSARGASKDIDDAADSVKRLSDGFTVAKGALATFAGNALTGLVGSIKDGISSLMSLSETTMEYREDIGKLETAFADAKVSVDEAKDTYSDFYAVLGEEDRSIEAVNHLAKFVDTEQDMAKWTDICTGVWGTFGDSLPIEGLTEAANETMKTGSLTGVLADALNWAGVSEDAFQESLDKCNTEQERQALITNTLNGLYKDAASAYRENNKSIIEARKATSEYNDAMAEAGEAFEPVSTAFTKFKTVLVKGFANLLKNLPMDKIVEKINVLGDKVNDFINDIDVEKIGESIGKFIDNIDFDAIIASIKNIATTVKNTVLPAINAIIANLPQIINLLKGVAVAVAGMKIVGFITNIVTLISHIKGMTTVMGVLKIAFTALTGPVGIVISIIGLLVAAFVSLWKNCDGFREFWINLWETLKSACGKAWDAIKGFFTGAWEVAKKAWSAAGTFFKEIFTAIVTQASENLKRVQEFFSNAWEFSKKVWSVVIDFFKDIFVKIAQKCAENLQRVREFFSSAWEFVKNVWSAIIGFFTDILHKVVEICVENLQRVQQFFKDAWEFVKGVWEAIVDFFTEILNKVIKICVNALDKIQQFFKDAFEFVKDVWNAIVDFFKEILTKVKDTVMNILDTIINTFKKGYETVKSAWGNIVDFFRNIWQGIKNVFSDVVSYFGDKFGNAWETIKSKFASWGEFWSGLWTKVKNKFSDIGANIGDAISNSIKSGINGVLGFVESVINQGIRLINGAIRLANLLPGVEVGTLDTISLPRLAKGGVLKKGQVGLLEGDGAEAVVPLDQNKKWIRKTAQTMAKELGMQKSISNQNSSSNVTNYNFTQNNNSPKALSRLEIYRQTKNQLALLRG